MHWGKIRTVVSALMLLGLVACCYVQIASLTAKRISAHRSAKSVEMKLEHLDIQLAKCSDRLQTIEIRLEESRFRVERIEDQLRGLRAFLRDLAP